MAAPAHVDVGAGRINPLAVISAIAALLAVAGLVGLGISAAAVFAVGAGHVSLHQIRQRGGRGRILALTGLVVGYGVATWTLAVGLQYVPSLAAGIF